MIIENFDYVFYLLNERKIFVGKFEKGNKFQGRNWNFKYPKLLKTKKWKCAQFNSMFHIYSSIIPAERKNEISHKRTIHKNKKEKKKKYN